MLSPITADAISAFPGAQGGGAISKGGRGGRVINVTSLADSGAGTLRECVLAKGPRICVFKKAGDIKLTSAIYITEPYLTVAGQTAPGGGIQISGATSSQNMIVIAAHDVVWQYTKIRKGYNPNNVGEWVQGSPIAMFSGSYNMMIDHNSINWNQDEGIGIWSDTSLPIKNVTLSNNLIAEGLYPHSTGIIVGSDNSSVAAQMTDIDMYNNLSMNNSHRNPLLTNKSSRIINNIIYNYAYYAIQAGSGVNLDVIGNKFKYGPLNAPTVREVQLYGSQSVYLSDNVGFFQPDKNGDQWKMASQVSGQNGTDYGNGVPAGSRRSTKMADTLYPITVRDVDTIEAIILPKAGASRRLDCYGVWVSNRDAVDARLVNQYQTNTGIKTLPRSHTEVGGFPVIEAGTPCADADNDGMPDVWEEARGLGVNDASDAIKDRNGDGFTNIEEYLAGSSTREPSSETPVPAPAPAPTVVSVSQMTATNDATNVTYSFSFTGAPTFLRVYLDTDRNSATGLSVKGIGADYMIENGNLYKHSGVGSGWSFVSVGSSNMVRSTSSVKFVVARSALGSPSAVNLVGNADNSAYSAIVNQTLAQVVVGTVINMNNVALERGNAYILYMTFPTAGDKSTAPRQSRLQIYENGVAIGPAHSAHADIRNLGRGRFSHWGNSLRFSSSDNTNPKRNGRVYTFKVLSAPAP